MNLDVYLWIDHSVNWYFSFHYQVVTKPPEFERFSEFGESSLADSDNDCTEPMMYSNIERKDIFVIEVGSLREDFCIVCLLSGRRGLHPNTSYDRGAYGKVWRHAAKEASEAHKALEQFNVWEAEGQSVWIQVHWTKAIIRHNIFKINFVEIFENFFGI